MTTEWIPKTKLGRAVKEGKFKSIDEVLALGKPILEHQIVDYLLPGLKTEIIEVRTTQRVTDSGRKMSYRVVVVVGDEAGHIGYGMGKSSEFATAREKAINRAKRNLIKVIGGCGSWECKCDIKHSLPHKVDAKVSATSVELIPAPRGVGLVANDNVKAILRLAGVKDIWSKVRGSVKNRYSLVQAVFEALKKIEGEVA
ncbi:MAG: 30S ribosomal protein S5 [Candidatus Micrarchaeota archaeon]|nr:30S ribosomal protein S5 [Candidatus Micrarchaeota archaeon]